MDRVAIAVAIIAVAALVAVVVRRRKPTAAPTAPEHAIPAQLDRADFASPQTPWLVAVFTSATCDACHEVWSKTELLASDAVAVERVEYPADRARHERYKVDAVPMVLVADAAGVVVHHTLGPINAADLWTAVANARGD